MSQGKGYVTLVSEKPYGRTTLYSFRISTEEKWFRTGDTRPSISKNDYISFFYAEKNGAFNVDVGSIEHLSREEPSQDSRSETGARVVPSGTGVSKDDYWRRREERDIEKEKDYAKNNLRIQYQSARNAAISVVDLLVRDKILKLSDAAKADNVAVVLGKIDDLTNDFFEKCSTINLDSSDAGAGVNIRGPGGEPVGENDKDVDTWN